MSMEVPSDSGEGGGPWKIIDKGMTMMVKDHSQNFNLVIRHGNSCFTEAQRRELELHARIFKHIANGLPVPMYLVLPVWISVANTLPGYGSVDKQLPRFIRDMVDSESGRCRRTDGKRWRCSKKALADEKYCERHMHRGCDRSRKHVEASKITSALATFPPRGLHEKFGPNTGSTISNPLGLSLMTTSSNDPHSSLPTVTNMTSSDRSKNSVDCVATRAPIYDSTPATTATSTSSANMATCASSPATVTTSMSYPTHATCKPSSATSVTSTSTPASLVGATFTVSTTTTNIKSTTSNNEINRNIEKKAKSDIINNIFIRSCENGYSMNAGINVSTGIGFSPNSLLQVLGCKDSCFNSIISTELEPGRCRRTDGKKWRCRRDVLADQKYCAKHMHRGAKRSVIASQQVTDPVSSVPASTGFLSPPTATIPKANTVKSAMQKKNHSISISSSYQQMHDDAKSHSSSDTEATISDRSK